MKTLNSLTTRDVRAMSDDNLIWLAGKTARLVLDSFTDIPDWLDRLEEVVESELQLRGLFSVA